MVLPRNIRLRDGAEAVVRRLTPADGDALAALFATWSDDDRAVFHPHPFGKDEARRRCDQSMVADVFVLVVASGESQPVFLGYAFLWRWDTRVPLLGLGVGTPYQGLGVGRYLVESLIEAARRSGKDAVVLTAYKQNERALALYRSVGFVVDGETDDGLQHRMTVHLGHSPA